MRFKRIWIVFIFYCKCVQGWVLRNCQMLAWIAFSFFVCIFFRAPTCYSVLILTMYLSVRYKDYRDPPWATDSYTFSKQYWSVLAAKLAFVIFFQVSILLSYSRTYATLSLKGYLQLCFYLNPRIAFYPADMWLLKGC